MHINQRSHEINKTILKEYIMSFAYILGYDMPWHKIRIILLNPDF